MVEYLCEAAKSSPWSLLFLLAAEVVLIGSVVFMANNYFFQLDHERQIQSALNEKRISRIEGILKEKGDLDTRAPWNKP
jgi:hypothetical protein